MDALYAFQLTAVLACLLMVFMAFVFGSILYRRNREPDRSRDEP